MRKMVLPYTVQTVIFRKDSSYQYQFNNYSFAKIKKTEIDFTKKYNETSPNSAITTNHNPQP